MTSCGISKRKLLQRLGGLALGSAMAIPAHAGSDDAPYDVIAVGGGNAGLPLAIFAARRGMRVLVVEAADQVGGTLFLSSGQMSAVGTKLQKSKGIEDDTPQLFYDDIMRISGGTANPDVVRLAVDNAAATADWLFDNGFQVQPDHPVLGSGHDPYSRKRYFWSPQGGLAILEVLEKNLKPEVERGRVHVLTQTEVTELVREGRDGAIVGVVTQGSGGKRTFRGRNVVLTTGGYCSNKPMFKQIEGHDNFGDTTYPYSQGAGVKMAVAAGGYIRGQQYHQPLFNAILGDDAPLSPLLVRIISDPNIRQPWEIFVNVDGKRFIREDADRYDDREKALSRQPLERLWVVFDEAIMKASPQIIRAWNKDKFAAAFDNYPLFYKRNSLPELAAAAGINGVELALTIADYNRAQADGNDKFGRRHMPLPIGKPPFYAMRMQGYFLLGCAGIAVDKELRVIRQDGKPIPNLYAAGEMLGFSAFQGSSYCGGMSVTPALTFGRLLGERMLPFKTRT